MHGQSVIEIRSLSKAKSRPLMLANAKLQRGRMSRIVLVDIE